MADTVDHWWLTVTLRREGVLLCDFRELRQMRPADLKLLVMELIDNPKTCQVNVGREEPMTEE